MDSKETQKDKVRRLYIAATKERLRYKNLEKVMSCLPKKLYLTKKQARSVQFHGKLPMTKNEKFTHMLIQQHIKVRNATERFQAEAKKLPDMEAVMLMGELHSMPVSL